jgi:hypothetical protein
MELIITYGGGSFIYPGSYSTYSNGDIMITLSDHHRVRLGISVDHMQELISNHKRASLIIDIKKHNFNIN